MMRIFRATRLATVLTLLPCLGVANPVSSPTAPPALHCAARASLLARLEALNQSRQAIGLAGQAVMELFAEKDSTRWTLTMTLPDGRMCLLAQGVAFDMGVRVSSAPGTAL